MLSYQKTLILIIIFSLLGVSSFSLDIDSIFSTNSGLGYKSINEANPMNEDSPIYKAITALNTAELYIEKYNSTQTDNIIDEKCIKYIEIARNQLWRALGYKDHSKIINYLFIARRFVEMALGIISNFNDSTIDFNLKGNILYPLGIIDIEAIMNTLLIAIDHISVAMNYYSA